VDLFKVGKRAQLCTSECKDVHFYNAQGKKWQQQMHDPCLLDAWSCIFDSVQVIIDFIRFHLKGPLRTPFLTLNSLKLSLIITLKLPHHSNT